MSDFGTTELIYFCIRSGCSLIASDIEQKIIPTSANLSLKVVTTETESNTASTAIFFLTPASISCSNRGIPNLSYVFSNSGSTSSKEAGPSISFGAE